MNPFSTFPMKLAPIPADRSENPAETATPLMDGFVDDAAIASLIAPENVRARLTSRSSDLALSSDENDFAGFTIRSASPFRAIAEKHELQVARQFSVMEEPGLGEPHRGNHRWWIAAVAGGASALVLSLLFVSLVDREASGESIASFAKPFEFIESAIGALTP